MPISISIHGVDKTPYLFSDDFGNYLGYTHPLGGRKVAKFTLTVPNGDYLPNVGETVQFFESDGTPVYLGTIDGFTKERLGNGPDISHVGYWLECAAVGLEQRLDKRYVSLQGLYSPQFVVSLVMSTVGITEGLSIGYIDGSGAAGVNIPLKVDNMRISDLFDSMATASNFIWYVDNVGALYFVPRTTTSAPFQITDIPPYDSTHVQCLRSPNNDSIGSMGYGDNTLNRTDLRNKSTVHHAYEALNPEVETWVPRVSAGINYIYINKTMGKLISLQRNSGNSAHASLTVTGIPADGDQVTIDGIAYTFKTTLDNTVPYQVLIGANAAACGKNLIFAIRRQDLFSQTNPYVPTVGDPTVLGTLFSMPTPCHPTVSAYAGAIELTSPDWIHPYLTAKVPGAQGNAFVVSISSSAITGAGTFAGGADGTIATLSNPSLSTPAAPFGVGLEWTYQDDHYYVLLNGGSTYPDSVTVTYYPMGADRVSVQNNAAVAARAAIEGGTGVYEAITEDSRNTNWNNALAEAQGFLISYQNLNDILVVTLDTPGLFPGMLVTVNLRFLNISAQTYLVQQVDTVKIGKGVVWGHFRYKVTMIKNTRIGTWLQFWKNLAMQGGGSTGIAGGGGGGTVGGFSFQASSP